MHNQHTYYAKCRHEPTAVFSCDDVTYWGGSFSKVIPEDWDGLVVNLLGNSRLLYTDESIETTEGWKSLKKHGMVDPPLKDAVIIDWRDGCEPDVHDEFWGDLHKLCVKKKVKDVLFYCIGGHGRTGTALASMLLTLCSEEIDPAEAISFIRNRLCPECIETTLQVKYLFELAGVTGFSYLELQRLTPSVLPPSNKKDSKKKQEGQDTPHSTKASSEGKGIFDSKDPSGYMKWLREQREGGWMFD